MTMFESLIGWKKLRKNKNNRKMEKQAKFTLREEKV